MTDEAQQDPISLAPVDKDWTWVLDEPCAECGFDAATVTREDIPSRLLAATPRWHTALAAPGVADRPSLGGRPGQGRRGDRSSESSCRGCIRRTDRAPDVRRPVRHPDGCLGRQWSRPGRRSNGSVFTMESLGLYYLHDGQHHLHDVGA